MQKPSLKPVKVAVLVLNYNGYRDTAHCLTSLKQVTGPFEPILIDNGSTDSSVEELSQAFPQITLLQTEENLGYAGGNNYGIRWALSRDFTHIMLLNNDVEVDPSFLTTLLDHEVENPLAILSPMILQFQNRIHIDHFGGYWNPQTLSMDLAFQGRSLQEVSFDRPMAVDYVCGCCLFAKKEVFEKVGPLDERFFLLWEETDFCFRAKTLGIPSYVIPHAKIYHKGSVSFSGGSVHTNYFWYRNRLLFMYKHRLMTRNACFTLLAEWGKQCKHCLLHAVKAILSREKKAKYIDKMRRNLASLHGYFDYLRMRFGKAPGWVVTTPPTKRKVL